MTINQCIINRDGNINFALSIQNGGLLVPPFRAAHLRKASKMFGTSIRDLGTSLPPPRAFRRVSQRRLGPPGALNAPPHWGPWTTLTVAGALTSFVLNAHENLTFTL